VAPQPEQPAAHSHQDRPPGRAGRWVADRVSGAVQQVLQQGVVQAADQQRPVEQAQPTGLAGQLVPEYGGTRPAPRQYLEGVRAVQIGGVLELEHRAPTGLVVHHLIPDRAVPAVRAHPQRAVQDQRRPTARPQPARLGHLVEQRAELVLGGPELPLMHIVDHC